MDALAQTDLVLAHNSAMLGADLATHQTSEAVIAAQGTAGISGNDSATRQPAAAEGISYAAATPPSP